MELSVVAHLSGARCNNLSVRVHHRNEGRGCVRLWSWGNCSGNHYGVRSVVGRLVCHNADGGRSASTEDRGRCDNRERKHNRYDSDTVPCSQV